MAADVERLQVAGVGVAEPAAQPPQVVPDDVAVQQLPLIAIDARLHESGSPALQRRQPLVTVGQHAASDQDGAEVVECFARRKLVEHLVTRVAIVAGEAGEQAGDGGLAQPGHRGDGAFDGDQRVFQRREACADPPVLAGENRVHALFEAASVADVVRAGLPGFMAGRAAVPEVRGRVNTLGAQRFPARSTADRGHDAAFAASRPPRLTGVAPRLAGGAGNFADPPSAADRAGHLLAWAAVLAPWPLRRARGDPAPSAAADAVLQIDRVIAQAVRAKGLSLGVAGGWFADGSAPGAGHRGVASEAVPADPPAIQNLGQCDHPLTARAGRPGNRGRASVDQLVDEPQHRRCGGIAASAGEQSGVVHHGPGQPSAPRWPGSSPLNGCQDRSRVKSRVDPSDRVNQ